MIAKLAFATWCWPAGKVEHLTLLSIGKIKECLTLQLWNLSSFIGLRPFHAFFSENISNNADQPQRKLPFFKNTASQLQFQHGYFPKIAWWSKPIPKDIGLLRATKISRIMKTTHSSFNECAIPTGWTLTKIEEHQDCDTLKLCRIMLCLWQLSNHRLHTIN